MCYAGQEEVLARPKFMPVEAALKLLPQAHSLGFRELHPFFTSDPFAYPDWQILCKAASDLGWGLVFFTNAALLDIETLLQFPKVSLTISLDSYSQETFERIRPGLDFQQVQANARRALLAAPREWGLRINYVVLPGLNDHELDSFEEVWGPLAKITFVPNDSRGPLKGSDRSSETPCESPFQGLSILSDGTAVMCCQDYRPLMPLGNAFESPLKDIWAGPTLQWVRAQHSTQQKSRIALCNQCKTRY